MRLENGATSVPVSVDVPPIGPIIPIIRLITNNSNGGFEICSTGPKSYLRLFVDRFSEWPNNAPIEREHDIFWKFDQNKLGRKALKTKASD
ncbi:MAG: hypothetical protein HQM08_04415 [Candidatus Riflebacteria bacterium]|nr:hypothetical protein [Candidatus Riflebacteria bacterium]